jgi:hypothetical protein
MAGKKRNTRAPAKAQPKPAASKVFTCALPHRLVNEARVAFIRIYDRAAEAKAIARAAQAWISEDLLDEDAQHALFRALGRCAEETERELAAFDALSLKLHRGDA